MTNMTIIYLIMTLVIIVWSCKTCKACKKLLIISFESKIEFSDLL